MNNNKTQSSACIFNNKYIFVIGGYFNGYLNDIEKYSIEHNTWENIVMAGDYKLPPKIRALSY